MKTVNWWEKERAKLESSVLVSFLSTWHKLELYEKRKHQLRRGFHKIQLFSVFLTCTWWRKALSAVGGVTPHSFVFHKKASWANYGEESRKKYPSMVSISALDSWFLSCMSSWGPVSSCLILLSLSSHITSILHLSSSEIKGVSYHCLTVSLLDLLCLV